MTPPSGLHWPLKSYAEEDQKQFKSYCNLKSKYTYFFQMKTFIQIGVDLG